MSLNFALILFVLLVVTGIVWAFDRLSLRPQRTARMARAAAEFDAGRAQSVRAASGETEVVRQRQEVVDRAGKMPWWVEYSVSFFRSSCLYSCCVRSWSSLSASPRVP